MSNGGYAAYNKPDRTRLWATRGTMNRIRRHASVRWLCWSLLTIAAATVLLPRAACADSPVSLAGQWRLALDREDAGLRAQWFRRDLATPDTIRLPGILQSQGYGDVIGIHTPWVLSLYDRHWYLREPYLPYTKAGHVKVPFLCQPPRHYLGAAWYQRDIDIPPDWQGKRVVLTLERTRWKTTVWLDDREIGSQDSLCAPHVFDLGFVDRGSHRLTIRVDNRMQMRYRPDAHSVSDSLGSSWNGIVGRIELSATNPVWIDDAQVFPDVARKSARIEVEIGNMTGQAGRGVLRAGDVEVPVSWNAEGAHATLEVPLGDEAQTWDEFHPVLQQLSLRLTGDEADDERQLVFGLRELRTDGNQFLLNGRRVDFRGTHNGGDFPLTGYPATDVESWKRIIRTCQEWGLNHMRFHSWCPPEAAFTAADELGFYLQPECGMWNEFRIGTPMEKMLYAETDRMIRAYGNHPSFLLFSPSNEAKGRWKECLTKWVEHYRQVDPRRLYTPNTGWSLIDEPGPVEGADFLAVHRIGPNMLRANSAWFGRDYSRSLRGVDVPVICHELGQWCAYPDYRIIDKLTGYLEPGNYEIFHDSLAAHGLADRDRDFAWASGRFQLACYKEEIEANLRTPGLGGMQLLDLHDYVGQGTALVGLLDTFWQPKGYATPEEFRRFCSETVPLARLHKRVYTSDDTFRVEVEVAHFGAAPLAGARPAWRIESADANVVAQGEWQRRTIPLGKGTPLGTVDADLSKLATPGAYRLVVGLDGSAVENDWAFWLYPAEVDTLPPDDVLVTRSWAEAEQRLAAGGKVLYVPRPAELDWTSPPLDRVPIFWNRLMNPGWGRMLGLWCDAAHPALAGFPTDEYCDWQWTEIVRGVRAVNLDRLPRDLEPIVQPIDDWNRNYKLGLVFECRVGDGRLVVCAVDLDHSLETRPVARQLRRSLLDYMASDSFQPTVPVAANELRGLLFDTRIMQHLGAKASGNGDAAAAIDGNPNTYWLSGDSRRRTPRHPHTLTIDFPKPVAMSGLVLMPRQNHREHEGDIREYVIEVSDDGQSWREVTRGDLASTFQPQTIEFSESVTATRLRLTALSGFGGDTTSALAELAVIYTGPPLENVDDSRMGYRRARSATPEVDEGLDAD